MTTIQPATSTTNVVTANIIKNENKHDIAEVKNKKSWLEKDIVLNVGFEESIKRGLITIFIPWPLLAINHNLLIYAAPVMFYLFVSALIHFCFIRYTWQYWVKHIPSPEICNLANDLHIPVEVI